VKTPALADLAAVVIPSETTRNQAVALESTVLSYLHTARGRKKSLKLLSADGEMCDLSEQLADLLVQTAAILARGDAVVVNALARELSTTEAATLLGMSRPTFIRLLDDGSLPYRRVGSHRRVDLKQVMAYRQQLLERQRQAYVQLMQASDELGIEE